MTNEDIHNIYTHMSGKAEGIAEITGSADFPVLFARGILELDRMDRKWVGLTDEEIDDFGYPHFVTNQLPSLRLVVRHLEAKLKEKNT